jgi:hypothetical protein
MNTKIPVKTSPKHAQRLPLVRTEWTETDPETGTEVCVEKIQRGVLCTEIRHYDAMTAFKMMAGSSARESLERYCEDIRDSLEKCGLPSDRIPKWIKIGDGEWEPLTDKHDPRNLGMRFSCTHWTKRCEDLTEPLTIERAGAKALHSITQMLKLDGIDKHLWHIVQAMKHYTDCKLAGSINRLAHQGVVAHKARAHGPKARRARADAVQAVIAAEAKSYWESHPLLRGNASNTALCILNSVNQRLRAENLLPRSWDGLSVKRIGDYIRKIR